MNGSRDAEHLGVLLLDLLRSEINNKVRAAVEERLEGLSPPQPDPWLTTIEAANYLRLTPEALRARIRRGTLPAYRDGHRLLLLRDELDHHVRHGDPDGGYPAPDND